MKYTFEQLPQAINTLHDKVDSIKALLLEGQKEQHSSYSDILTIGQAAEFLKLSVPTLYTKVSLKQIPVSKRGKRLYFSKDELSDWIKAGKKTTAEETQNDIKHKHSEENPPPQ